MYAREDDTLRHREWEEEGRRRMTEQRRQEQDGILRRQSEATHAAQAARLGHPTGQNPSVTVAPAGPVSASFSAPMPSIQYPSISAPATASAQSGPIAAHLQMPLESPTRCVILHWNGTSLSMFSWYLKNSNTGYFKINLIERETLFPFWRPATHAPSTIFQTGTAHNHHLPAFIKPRCHSISFLDE
jgi:hypothetical protein